MPDVRGLQCSPRTHNQKYTFPKTKSFSAQFSLLESPHSTYLQNGANRYALVSLFVTSLIHNTR